MHFKKTTILSLCLILTCSQVLAQKEALIGAAGAAIAAGVGLAITAENIREKLEADATNYILENFPEKECFELKLLTFSASQVFDASNVSIIPFTLAELDKNTLAVVNREVLLTIRSDGWMNEFGVDVTKVSYRLLDQAAWDDLFLNFLRMVAPPLTGGQQVILKADSIPVYDKLASKEFAEFKDHPSTIVLVSKGASGYTSVDRYKPASIGEEGFATEKIGLCRLKDGALYNNYNELVMPLRSIGDKQFLVADYSEDFKIVYSEESFSLFLKRTNELVKLRRNAANEIHKFLHQL